jgi:hypothetical protein
LKYAAVFFVATGFSYFFMNQKSLPVVENDLIITKDATLELANGDLKVINSNGEERVISKTGKVIEAK